MDIYSPKHSAFDKLGRMEESRRVYNNLINRRKLRMVCIFAATMVNFFLHVPALSNDFPGIWKYIMPVYSVYFTVGLLVLSYRADYENKVLLPILLGGFVIGMIMHAYNPVIAIFLFALFFTQRWEYREAEWVAAQDGYPDFVYVPDEDEMRGEQLDTIKWKSQPPKEMDMFEEGSMAAAVPARTAEGPLQMPALDAAISSDLKITQEDGDDRTSSMPQRTLESVSAGMSGDLSGTGAVDMREPPYFSETLSRHTGWLGVDMSAEREGEPLIPDVGREISGDLRAGARGNNEETEPLSIRMEKLDAEKDTAIAPESKSPQDPLLFPDSTPFFGDPLQPSDFPEIAGDIQDLPDVPDLPDIPDIPVI